MLDVVSWHAEENAVGIVLAGSNDCGGKIKVRPNSAESTDMVIAVIADIDTCDEKPRSLSKSDAQKFDVGSEMNETVNGM